MNEETSGTTIGVSPRFPDGDTRGIPKKSRQMNTTWSTVVISYKYTLQRRYRLYMISYTLCLQDTCIEQSSICSRSNTDGIETLRGFVN